MDSNWLPTTKKEVDKLGWKQLDVILFTGDAYIDHPSFGIAIIGRVLESMGLKVAVVPQPNWQDDLRDFRKLGEPSLFFGVSGGNMDSMVNHYTANKRLRSNDAFSPGGKAGFRPDYATSVYSQILKQLFPDVPVIIGGIEASLRRFTHYDYWSDTLKPPILVDSRADLLVYGMGELAITDIVRGLLSGKIINELIDIPQTAYISNTYIPSSNDVQLSSYDQCVGSKTKFVSSFRCIEEESNKMYPSTIIEPVNEGYLVVNPPYKPLDTPQIDSIYSLPFNRLPHPKYSSKGVIPAYEMIKHSVNIHRGCFGGCSFCTISAHQGKFIQSRSFTSVIREVQDIMKMPDFKGYITDLGGPSANMFMMKGVNPSICASCKRPSCIWPSICGNLNMNHQNLVDLYATVRKLPGVKKATIGSGIRYDMLLNDMTASKQYINDLIRFHVSGRLKVAPEHSINHVLKLMRKPSFSLFRKFFDEFTSINISLGLKQQLIPYFISSHPGCTLDDMRLLASQLKYLKIQPEQVQDFTPTPMTLASAMYYSGIDPYSLKNVSVARTREEKQEQKDKFFWKKY